MRSLGLFFCGKTPKIEILKMWFYVVFTQETNKNNIKIDVENYIVTINDAKFLLPKKEFELLHLLASRPGKVFRREEIYLALWGDDVVVGDRTIDVHVRRIREKLGLDNIKTIKGVGYKYEE